MNRDLSLLCHSRFSKSSFYSHPTTIPGYRFYRPVGPLLKATSHARLCVFYNHISYDLILLHTTYSLITYFCTSLYSKYASYLDSIICLISSRKAFIYAGIFIGPGFYSILVLPFPENEQSPQNPEPYVTLIMASSKAGNRWHHNPSFACRYRDVPIGINRPGDTIRHHGSRAV